MIQAANFTMAALGASRNKLAQCSGGQVQLTGWLPDCLEASSDVEPAATSTGTNESQPVDCSSPMRIGQKCSKELEPKISHELICIDDPGRTQRRKSSIVSSR